MTGETKAIIDRLRAIVDEHTPKPKPEPEPKPIPELVILTPEDAAYADRQEVIDRVLGPVWWCERIDDGTWLLQDCRQIVWCPNCKTTVMRHRGVLDAIDLRVLWELAKRPRRVANFQRDDVNGWHYRVGNTPVWHFTLRTALHEWLDALEGGAS